MRLAHIPLRTVGHAVGIGDQGFLGIAPDYQLIVVEQHDAGSQQVALAIADHDRTTGLVQPSDGGVSRPQIDPNGLRGRHWPVAATWRELSSDSSGRTATRKHRQNPPACRSAETCTLSGRGKLGNGGGGELTTAEC